MWRIKGLAELGIGEWHQETKKKKESLFPPQPLSFFIIIIIIINYSILRIP